jgi:molybdenum cofactor cytidylyltransferase
MIAGIVLAGGRSQRMGRPKATLKVGDETFLERAIRTLKTGGCTDVVVVLNVDDAGIFELTAGAGGRVARGGGLGTEQIESLRAGLRVLPLGADAAIVLPVDYPLVAPATVEALIGEYLERDAPIVMPTHGGRRGHPVLFSARLFEELLDGDPPEGARSVIRAHADEAAELEANDPGVLVDVDTPDVYRLHFGELE